MARGIFRSPGNPPWAQVDYGMHSVPIPEPEYRQKGYEPDFDELPWEVEYKALQEKAQDDASRS
jgi:hypothetical protein